MSRRERGSALIIVVVFLGVMAVAMAGIVRSTNTTARTAGNVAFKQAATQVGEIALADAEAWLAALAAPATAVTNRYYPWMQTTDTAELPTTVNWTNVPTTLTTNVVTVPGGYTVQWVAERMCNQPVAPRTAADFDATVDCMTVQGVQQGSQRAGSPNYSTQAAIYYRITARITGPRSTESYVQAAVAR